MRNILINVLTFATGAAIGAVVAWKVASTKYESIIQEEVDSVKEIFARRQAETTTDDTEEGTEEDNEEDPREYDELDKYRRVLENHKYVEREDTERPYLIESEEYGEYYDYTEVTLSYYTCGTLVDDDSNEIVEIDLVGEECLTEFEDESVDVIHVRNDVTKCDYEISRDPRTYADLMGSFPYLENE